MEPSAESASFYAADGEPLVGLRAPAGGTTLSGHCLLQTGSNESQQNSSGSVLAPEPELRDGVPEHTGDIIVDGRGHRKHYWSCCGCRVNHDSPYETAVLRGEKLEPEPGEAVFVEGAWVARVLGKLLALKEMQKRARAAERLARAPKASKQSKESAAAAAAEAEEAEAEWKRSSRVLRQAQGCTEKQRAEWKERKTYMQHVFEILQTEEIYVSFRLACEHGQEQQRFEVFLRR